MDVTTEFYMRCSALSEKKLENGTAERYREYCDATNNHYEDMMNLGGTFGLMGRVADV